MISAIAAVSSGVPRSETARVRPIPDRSSIRTSSPFSPGACAGTVDTTVPLGRSRSVVHAIVKSSASGA
uniref:hypothetical protein n=1 Tax=Nocardia sp. XZ_19_385 TaxID=2769488 RepID=UPI001E613BA2|nr:hypothetical protein [Nocardia sp. XZ_19_385]